MKQIKTISDFVARAPQEGPRVLLADIETFPIIAYVWGLFKQNIGLPMMKDSTKLMSFAGKWLQDDAYYYVDNSSREDPRDDTLVAAASYTILQETDIVIAHNGQRFDMKKLRARYAMMEFPPLPVIPVIDTLLQNRRAFGFDSQKLAYVTSVIGSHEKDSHGDFPGFLLWDECMKGNPLAWDANHTYNVTDITSMEEMYLKLRGWYQGAANLGVYFDKLEEGNDEHRCPNCGSTHVHARGTRRTQVGIYTRYHCQGCGGWSRGRTMLVSKEDRSHILMN